MKFTSSQSSRAYCNSTIIYFYQREQNLTQFVKVLLVKLSVMTHSSNFVRLFHRQSFTLYGSYNGIFWGVLQNLNLLQRSTTCTAELSHFQICIYNICLCSRCSSVAVTSTLPVFKWNRRVYLRPALSYTEN